VVVTDDKAAAIVKVAQQDLDARGSTDKTEVVRAMDNTTEIATMRSTVMIIEIMNPLSRSLTSTSREAKPD
jgi:hypothetical protein